MTPSKLKTWRKKHGYSQARLANVLGVYVMTVSRWERGITEIPPYMPFTLAGIEAMHGGGQEYLKQAKQKRK